MDLIFNELSENPLSKDHTEAFERVNLFISTFKKAYEYGFNKIRFDKFEEINLCSNFSLCDFLKKPENRTRATLLYGLRKHPFIDDDSPEEKRYVENVMTIKKGDEELKPYGLFAAYLYSTVGIGFCSDQFWGSYEFRFKMNGKELEEYKVFCVSNPEHLNNEIVKNFIEDNSPIVLVKSDACPENKNIHLREDHGKEELQDFSNKIIKSPYIVEVINSLPFNPYERNYIKKVYPNGNVEIVLVGSDKGLGLVVKTTGRNLKETKKIAEIIEKEYF